MTEEINDIVQLRLLWLIGVLERLSTLGFIQNVPYTVTPDNVDLFNSINPLETFSSEDQIREYTTKLVREEQDPEYPMEESMIQRITDLVIDYKRNPLRLARLSLTKGYFQY